MSGNLLALGLLGSGGLGFIFGARPSLLTGKVMHGHPDRAQEVMEILYPLAVAFFAGFVFSTLVPHALTHSRGSLIAFGGGVAVMAVLSKLVFKRDPCCEVGHDHAGFGAMSLLAMSVCSLNDGLLIGLLDPQLLSGLNLGMILHKITSSFAIAQVLRSSKFKGYGLAAFGIVYTLVSPAALLAAHGPLAKSLPDSELVLGFSAGLLTYVILVNLIPQARGIMKRRPRIIYGFAAAFLCSVGLGLVHSDMHESLERLAPSEAHQAGSPGQASPKSSVDP